MLRMALISLALLAGGAASAAPCFARNWAETVHSHRDLGEGRVGWTWSWNAEGIADDLIVVECRTGQGLAARARAERMTQALPYDRRRKALRLIEQAAAAPHFFKLTDLRRQLEGENIPARLIAPETEPCACALHYPDAWPS